MTEIIISLILQSLLLLCLCTRNKNDGEKRLFLTQNWNSRDALIALILFNGVTFIPIPFMAQLEAVRRFFLMHRYLDPLILFLCVAGFSRLRDERGLMVLGLRGGAQVKAVVLLVVGGSLCFMLVSALVSSANDPSKWLPSERYWYYAQYGFTAVIVAPFAEEGVFRGILYSVYRKKYGAKLAIILTAIMFSVAHIGGMAIIQFIVGALSGILYERTQSLAVAAGAHGGVNLLVFTLMVVQNQVGLP